jgi:hypothetical protein
MKNTLEKDLMSLKLTDGVLPKLGQITLYCFDLN